MYEYAAFNPFNASPEGLAAELTRKSAEGWEVVSITTTADGRFCAFLRRPVAQRSVSPTSSTIGATTTAGQPGYAAVGGATESSSGSSVANPSVPAAWYKDPSGRFELRYWNGTAWTEHVARGGQQFTDPPVA